MYIKHMANLIYKGSGQTGSPQTFHGAYPCDFYTFAHSPWLPMWMTNGSMLSCRSAWGLAGCWVRAREDTLAPACALISPSHSPNPLLLSLSQSPAASPFSPISASLVATQLGGEGGGQRWRSEERRVGKECRL